MRTPLVILCCALVTACGVKRPLMAPKDIPAYERERQEKMEKKRRFEEEQRLKQQQQQPPISPQG